MLDISTRLVPFINHNDVIRIQMAAGHARQSIPLINAQVPFIRTGFEEQYLDYSSYLFRAKDDGVVTYNDDVLMICKYDNGSGEVINLGGPYGNREGFDKQLHTNLKENDRFNKNDILAHHTSITEDGFLALGCNLKTTYISHPYNYKDALLISESCAQKMCTKTIHQETIDCTDTIPILWNDNNISYPQGTYVEKAKPIFVVKERNPSNPMHIVSEGEEILAPISGKLYYKVKIDEIVRTKNEENFYDNLYKEEIEKEELIAQKIKEIYDQDTNEDKYTAEANINYYCPQLNKRRTGKSIVLTYWIVKEAPIIVGCKLSNRHGNKGVVAAIFEDKDMPMDRFNEHADICVSSMCVSSRMNTGQLFELHTNRANHLYCLENLKDEPNNDNVDSMIEKVYNMISQVQPNYINDVFKEYMNNASIDDKIKYINEVKKYNVAQIVHPSFTKFTYEDLFKFCKDFGKMDDDLKEDIVFGGENIRASFGHQTWYRLEHEPNKKYFARSISAYGKIGQPARNNGSNKGAHRFGEMETWAMFANQAYENLLELMVAKSDSLPEAARLLKYMYDGCSMRYTPFDQTPGILKVFKIFVEAAGYEMKDVELDENGNIINNYDDNDDKASVKLSEPKNNLHDYYDLDISEEMKVLSDYV